MRAVEFSGARRFAIVDRPDPEPGLGDLLIAPESVGICATDLELFDGTMAYYRTGQATYPIVPGHEWSGEIVGIGAEVSGFAVGNHVVGEVSIGCGRCDLCRTGNYHLCVTGEETGIMRRGGALASLLLHPAASTFTVPHQLSWDAAALIEPASVALHAARRGDCRNKTVLVIGMGTIGQLALQCARAEGATRTVAANPSAQRLALATTLGADATVGLPASLSNARAAITAAAGPAPIDVVLVCTGASSAVALAIEAVRPGGVIVLAGLSGAAAMPIDHDLVVLKDIDLRGVNGSPSLWPDTVALVATGAVRTEPLVTHHLPLTEIARALELVRARGPETLKVIVQPQGR
ncbi:MAG: alcohol dehydrogenase catalytic domain-containing protein [Chloroflexota bacterium]|nr:alcohol dehydrogenase catalytic domain-containing protein [Chloroflexota bacterium]